MTRNSPARPLTFGHVLGTVLVGLVLLALIGLAGGMT